MKCTSFDHETGGLANQPYECVNLITLIQQIPSRFKTNDVDEEQVLVCGTNAHFPKCTIHELASLSNYSFVTSRQDLGYSRLGTNIQVIAILASNGRFFSAAELDTFAASATIGMAKNPLGGDSLFRIKTLTDVLHLPEYLSIYEISEYIYFFIRERAYEEESRQSVIYSRVIRICKSDNGQDSSSENNDFLTYQKARIKCSVRGKGTHSIPYMYTTTTTWHPLSC